MEQKRFKKNDHKRKMKDENLIRHSARLESIWVPPTLIDFFSIFEI